MAVSFSRQVPVFVLALLVALYQVNKARQVATQWESEGETQLRKAKVRIAQALPQQRLRFLDENPRPGKPLSRTVIISVTHADHPPTVIGEVYVDPAIKRDLQLQRQRSRYASRSASPTNKAKARSGTLPLLAMLVEDSILLEAAQEMQKRGIVSRVVKGKALTIKEAATPVDADLDGHKAQGKAVPNQTVNTNDPQSDQELGPPESSSNSISKPSREGVAPLEPGAECAASLLETEASCDNHKDAR